MPSVRVAILRDEPLSKAERYGLEALLARTGLAVTLHEPGAAQVVLAYGRDAGDSRLPAVQLPRGGFMRGGGIWRLHALGILQKVSHASQQGKPDSVAFRKALEAQLHGDSSSEKHITLQDDLILFTASILQGWDEDHGCRDDRDRFDPEASIIHRVGLLGLPVVDLIARQFGIALARAARLPAPPIPHRFAFHLTFDIDSAGMFRGLRGLRQLGVIARQFPFRFPSALSLALRSRIGLGKDPHLRLRALGEALEADGIPSTFFVQTHRRHRLDSYDLRYQRELRRELTAIVENQFHTVGLHSSFATARHGHRFLKQQRQRLKHLIPGARSVHRGHYLRTPPDLAAGIDSTIAFGARSGFRRGTSHPFSLGDGATEIPPCWMDSTQIFFEHLTPEASLAAAVGLMRSVRAVGGHFTPIFHPHLMDEFLYPERYELLFDMIDEARKLGAVFLPLRLSHSAKATA